ncbi:MAG: putative zinc-binding protein [Euryarchaeota archaeon]|nr:putative zinc-binding protein [Euryarchaeota archaeon]
MSNAQYSRRPIEITESEKAKPTVFSCSGSANVGQLANSCALGLGSEGLAAFACIAGVGCHEETMLDFARGSPKVLALDGCPTSCCSRSLQHAGIKVDVKAVMTDLMGMVKEHDALPTESEVKGAMCKVRRLI